MNVEEKLYDGKTLAPGAMKTKSFLVYEGDHTDKCYLSLALARPWMFKGFNPDGSLVDESSAADYYIIPIFY